MNDPLVTILVPTYSRADLLPDAIRSGLAQTHVNLELIVLDDASPDDGRTMAAVKPFLKDPRVRYVRHSANLGIAENWRAGISKAAGEYFCLLHDDDTFEPTFLREMLAVMVGKPDVVIAFCDHWITDAAGNRLIDATDEATRKFGRHRLPSGALVDFARSALIDTSVPIGATLFRRVDVLPEFIDAAARGSIDMWLLYGCVSTGKRAMYVSKRLMNYRSHSGGMSASQPLYMTEGHLWRYERMLADQRLAAIHVNIEDLLIRTLADYGVHLLAAGRRAEAMAALQGIPGRKAKSGRVLARAGPFGTAALRLSRTIRHCG